MTESMWRSCVRARVALRSCVGLGSGCFCDGEVLSHLIFGLLPLGNVLRSPDEAPDFASGIAYRKSVDPYPTNVSIREGNSELPVELTRSGRFIQFAEHSGAVLGMDYLLIRS